MSKILRDKMYTNRSNDNAKIAGFIFLFLSPLFLLGAIFFHIFTTTTDEHELLVTAQEAFYQVPVEEFQPRQKGGWDETVPADAYNKSSHRKQRGSHQQFTGQTCTGTKIRTCINHYITIPDYDTWVGYTVDRWEVERIVTAAYHSSKENLLCPDPDIIEDSPENVHFGSQRAMECLKSYSVYLMIKGDRYDCPVTEELWFLMPIEKVVVMQIGRYTRAPWCGTIKVK